MDDNWTIFSRLPQYGLDKATPFIYLLVYLDLDDLAFFFFLFYGLFLLQYM